MSASMLRKPLLMAGVAAPLVLLVATVAAGARYPDYSHISQFISELGASGAPSRAVLNYGGLIPAGLLTALFGLAIYLYLGPGPLVVLSAIAVVLSGAGRLTAGLFSCDPGCSLEAMSGPAQVHAIAGLVALFAGVFAPLLLAIGLRFSPMKRLREASFWIGVASLLTFVVLGLVPPETYAGLFQRFLLVLYYGWIILVALRVWRLGSRTQPRPDSVHLANARSNSV